MTASLLPRVAPRARSRFLAVCLALLLLLEAALPAAAATPSAMAQEPVAPAAPTAFVEHWIGTGVVEGSLEYAYVDGAWYEPEAVTGSSVTAYDLYVDGGGKITGLLKVRWQAATTLQPEARPNCLPAVAENSYHGYDCTISQDPANGSFTFAVKGTRTLKADGSIQFKLETDDRPIRVWRTMTGIQFPPDGGWLWTHRGPGRASAFFPPDGGMEFGGTPVPTYGRVLVEDTEVVDSRYNAHVWEKSTFAISLFEVGADPTLDLDLELLERSVFMDQVSVPDALTANATWQTVEGGKTDWRLPAGPESTPLSKETVIKKSVDVGTIGVGEHPVTTKGTDSLNRSTTEEILKVVVARYFTRCPSFTASKQGAVVTYKCEVKAPKDEPFEARIDKVWDFVPYFGGKPLGLGKTQITAAMELKSTGEGSVQGDATALFDVMGSESGGKLIIKADLLLKPEGVVFQGGSIEINLIVRAKRKEGLLKAIPALTTPLTILRRFAAPAADYLENTAQVELVLEGLLGTTFPLVRDPDPAVGWKFDTATPKAGVGFSVEAALKFWKGNLEGKAKVSGDTTFTFNVPKNPDYLKSVELKFVASASLKAFGYENTAENAWVFNSSGAVAADGTPLTTADVAAAAIAAGPVYSNTTGWVLSDRSYLTQPGYSQWVGPLADGKAVRGDLVARTSPGARSDFLHFGNYQEYLVWSYEQPDGAGIGPDNGGEIALANLGPAASYRPPNGFTLMTNDDRNDLNPQIATRQGSNLPVVVWERMDTPTPGSFPNDPEAYLSHLQVAASIFTPTLASPTLAPVQISTSGSLNHRPQVTGRGSNTEIFVAVWINNPASKLMGDATYPDRLMYSFYDRNKKSWTAPLAIPGDIPGIQSFDIGTWRDESGTPYRWVTTLAFVSGGEIYVTEFRNTTEGNPATGSWSPITRVTNSAVSDGDIQIEFVGQWNEGNDLVATWRAGNTLMALTGTGTAAWSGAPQSIATLPEQAGPPELAPKIYPYGPMVAWTQPGGMASVRLTGDPPAWTHPRLVETGARTPTYVLPAVSYDPTPGIGIAPILITHLETSTAVTRTLGGVQYPNFPVVTQRDLVAVNDPTRPVSTTLDAESVGVLPGNPVRVVATVENRGDVDAPNMALSLIARVPGSPPTETTLAQQALVIPNNTRIPVTLTVTAPTPASAALELHLAEVGCDFHCAPPATLLLPTDAVAWRGGATTYAPNATIATLYVGQVGPLPHTAPIDVLVRNGRGGPVVAQVAAGLVSTPTALVQVSAPISTALLGPGEHILEWEIVSDGPMRDPNPGNNVATSLAIVAPDLYIAPAFTRLEGSVVRARVENRGNWPSVATVLEVWSAPPGTTGAVKLGSIAVPALAPGAHADLSGAVAAAEAAAPEASAARYLLLDPANLVQEIDENGNLTAIAGTGSGPIVPPTGQFRILLPLVEK